MNDPESTRFKTLTIHTIVFPRVDKSFPRKLAEADVQPNRKQTMIDYQSNIYLATQGRVLRKVTKTPGFICFQSS